MKNKLLYKSIFSFYILIFLPGLLFAQSYSASESLSKSAAVPEGVDIVFTNKSADLIINTTNENVISIKTDIKVTGRSEEDVNLIIESIKNFEFEQHGNTFEIDTRFYKNMMSIGIRSTMTLLNGEKVRIKDFEVQHELSIPKTASLKLDNKYSEIEMGDLDGEADFTLYSSTIHAGDIGSDSEIAMKYSKAYMENLKDVDFDLYDSDVIFENSGDLTVSSKYSKFEAKNTGKMDIKSYDDKFKVALVSNVNIETKYSDFEFSSDINKVELDFYDSNFSAGNVEQCTYQGKYSELIFVSVKNLDISNSYDDKFELGKTKQVKVTESKYSDYLLKQSSSFLLDGYDDNITIEKLSDGFEGPINVNGKYIKLDIDSDNEPYQVYFNIKYAKIDLPTNVQISKRIEKSSNLELVGNSTGGKIIVEGYDMTVNIR